MAIEWPNMEGAPTIMVNLNKMAALLECPLFFFAKITNNGYSGNQAHMATLLRVALGSLSVVLLHTPCVEKRN